MHTGTLGQATMGTRPAAMEKPAHACAMCTRPFFLFGSKGMGIYEANVLYTYINCKVDFDISFLSGKVCDCYTVPLL